jgi:predicted metal-dependent phosphoesterase TrpH
MRIDLHNHTTASDGMYSPSEVIQIAINHNMDVIAITDHDTIEGVRPAQQAALAAGAALRVVAGVELSTFEGPIKPHVLGYLFDVESQPFQVLLHDLRTTRIGRSAQIVDKLAQLGVEISIDRVYQLAGDGASVGRPHIARALVERGYVDSIGEAFTRYIGDDGPAYVPNFQLTPADAIAAIHAAGGVAVLAHPGLYEDFPAIIERLVPLGLDGVETYYYDHLPEQVRQLEQLAAKHGLIRTVGGDFHRREPDASARIGKVKFPATLDIIGALESRAQQYHG